MRPPLRHAILAGAASVMLVVASSSSSWPLARPQGPTAAAPAGSVTADAASAGERWLTTTRAALDGALEVRVPFEQQAPLAGEGGAAAFAFDAYRGQTLELTLAQEPAALEGARVYVEVFRVVDVLGQQLRERLSGLRPGAHSLRTRLPSDGRYDVLVQTDGGAGGEYRLTLELAAALPFPVVGASEDAIRSLFGASRDDGRRNHAGVDIFVQRLTPVLAVVAGRAMPGRDALGGNTVWLNTPGVSYYYAHLDRIAVRTDQMVKAGDVLGYVGNTGNARNVASHLHFGIYRWGRDPIDPLPLLVGQRFDGEVPAASAAGAGGGG